MNSEHLFVDASHVLDEILRTGGKEQNLCKQLWNSFYSSCRELDGTLCDKEDTKAEVAMLFYAIMYALLAAKHSHYRGTLFRSLHETILKYYGVGSEETRRTNYLSNNRCLDIENKLRIPVNELSVEMETWMDEYLKSSQSLTKEIDAVLNPPKPSNMPKTKKPKKEEDKTPYVLKYICKDETTRSNRLQRAMILMQKWNWIEEPMGSDDFFDFFTGRPRACNLKWKKGKKGSNTTVLTLLIQVLLDQPFFEDVPGASTLSIVKNQFGFASANYDYKKRITSEDKNRIQLIVLVLDPNVSFPQLRKRGRGDGYDYSDESLNAAYQEGLHITKDLLKKYDI